MVDQIRNLSLSGGLFGLLWQKDSLNVGQDASLSNGNTSQKFVELLIIPDGQLQVSGNDPGFLVVSGSIASKFQDFGSKVLHDCGEVNRGSCINRIGVVSLLQETMDTADRKLKTSTR